MKDIVRWLGIAFFLVLILALIVIPVQGYEYIVQGDTVYLNETVDVSGVLNGYDAVVWYGKYGEYVDPKYIIGDQMVLFPAPELPSGHRLRSQWYGLYIDPEIFSQRYGAWYKFDGNTTGTEHGNLVAFYVSPLPKRPEPKVTNTTPTPVPTPTPEQFVVSPKKFDTDFQVAYGDSLAITVNNKTMPSRLWVFGRVDAFYNRSFPTSKVNITAKDIQGLETGTYTLIVQNPGKNAIFEVGYGRTVSDTITIEELVSPWGAVKPVDIFGFQPRMVLVEFRKMIAGTDDPITEYRLEIVPPIIDMVSVDETYFEGKDVLDIRGYTNVARGTEITFIMDKEKQTARTIRDNTYMEIVRETAPNMWRYFQVYIPINYDETPVGPHFISASTPQGATQTIPFFVYDLPEGQVVPNATIKYVSGNLFVPTPTPIIVTEVVTQIVTQIVTVPVTPRDDVVYAQHKKASDTTYWESAQFWGKVLAGLLLIGGISYYGISVIKRARLK